MDMDAYACLIIPCSRDLALPPTNAGWQEGPLPLAIPQLGSAGAHIGTSVVTNAQARSTHVAARVQNSLYGTGRRWHRFAEALAPSSEGAVVEAWELLASEAPQLNLAIAHVQLPADDPVGALFALSGRRGPGRDWLASTLPTDVVLEAERPRLVSHVMWRGDRLHEPVDDAHVIEALSGWTTVQRWMWFLGTGLAPQVVLPDTDAPDLFDGIVRLSRDWRACVLRDGAAYVALNPVEGDGPTFHHIARVFVRSIHLDSILLGTLQIAALHGFANKVSTMMEPRLDAASVEELEGGLLILRTELWWTDVADQGRQTTDVLAAFQRQHHLPELYSQIASDLTDAARFVEAKQARREDEREREEAHREQRTQHLFSLVTFLLFPLTVVFSGAALVGSPQDEGGAGIGTLLWSTAIGLVLGLAIYLVMAFMRRRGVPTVPASRLEASEEPRKPSR
jgi:hypothetical protein